ncbi:hypothetical protein D9M68_733950 [compost metagenome]
MEHSPIEELPTNLRRTFQQAKAIRVDQLQRQRFSQLRSTARILAIDANLKLPLAVTGNPQAALPPVRQLHLTKNRTSELLVLNHRQ